MKTFQLTPLAALLVSVAPTVSAQTEQAPLSAVSITSSPIIESNNTDRFSSLTTKVTDAQVKNLGALDLAAALRMTPGVQISRYNEVGSFSGDQGGNVYIRGLGSSRPGSEIKTYLDGVPLYMGIWNHPLLDLLPLQGIKSLEIQKGPQSQVSGNNLSAIHLQSKRASKDGLQGEVNASAGSFGTYTVHGNLLGRLDDIDFSLSAGYVASKGDRSNADSKLSNAMGRLTKKIDTQWEIGASFLSVGNEVGDPGDNRFMTSSTAIGPYSFSNGIGRDDTRSELLTLFASHTHATWKGEIKAYVNRGHNNLTDDANWGTFASNFQMYGFRWKESGQLWTNGELSWGLDQDSVTGDVSGPHVGAAVGTPWAFMHAGSADVPTFRITSAYLGISQDIHLPHSWLLRPSAGIRAYDSNVYASKAAPHVGVSLQSSGVNLYANVQNGLLYPGAETYTLTRAIPMAFSADNGWNRLSPTEDQHTEVGAQWTLSDSTQWDISV